MLWVRRAGFMLVAVGIVAWNGVAGAQQSSYPKPTDLPNPYRLVEGWPTLPKNMNGGWWGEVIRVHVARDGERLLKRVGVRFADVICDCQSARF